MICRKELMAIYEHVAKDRDIVPPVIADIGSYRGMAVLSLKTHRIYIIINSRLAYWDSIKSVLHELYHAKHHRQENLSKKKRPPYGGGSQQKICYFHSTYTPCSKLSCP